MLAKIVNDDAFQQDKRGVHESIASKLAPTGVVFSDEQDARLAALPHLAVNILCARPLIQASLRLRRACSSSASA